MKKALLSLVHNIRLLCSKTYRQQYQLKSGKQVWDKLNSFLPEATGSKKSDAVRIEGFIRLLPVLSQEEKNSLRAWLKKEIYELTHNFAEHTSGLSETIEQKLWQIYNDHLSALEKNL